MDHMTSEWFLTGLMAVAAFLYASVGHAGASGYLAAMALVGMSGAMMKPTALILNIVVASVAFVQFYRARQFSWPLLWPFALTSVPLAYVGGMVPATGPIYRVLVGIVLLASAGKLIWDARSRSTFPAAADGSRLPRWWVAAGLGGIIGCAAGLTGTGGGIFLSPLLVLMGWGRTQQSGGVAAAFILLNSVAGLFGHGLALAELSPWMPVWMFVVLAGGTAGSYLGSRRATPEIFKRLLAIVLVVAGIKLIVS